MLAPPNAEPVYGADSENLIHTTDAVDIRLPLLVHVSRSFPLSAHLVISPIVENLLPLRPPGSGPKTNVGYRSRSQMPGSRISKFLSRIQPGIPTVLFTTTLVSQVVYRYFLVSSRSS
ncbi:unnamed protein product [Arabidopsis halleri]